MSCCKVSLYYRACLLQIFQLQHLWPKLMINVLKQVISKSLYDLYCLSLYGSLRSGKWSFLSFFAHSWDWYNQITDESIYKTSVKWFYDSWTNSLLNEKMAPLCHTERQYLNLFKLNKFHIVGPKFACLTYYLCRDITCSYLILLPCYLLMWCL